MISDGMIHEVTKKYKLLGIGSLTTNHYKGHNYKITGDQEKAVVEFVENTLVASTKVVIKWVKKHFGIAYTHKGCKSF